MLLDFINYKIHAQKLRIISTRFYLPEREFNMEKTLFIRFQNIFFSGNSVTLSLVNVYKLRDSDSCRK